jgi:hypothetical protein
MIGHSGGIGHMANHIPIVTKVFVFFVFFGFSRWFCYGFGRASLVFWVFWVFLDGFGYLAAGCWLLATQRSLGTCRAI